MYYEVVPVNAINASTKQEVNQTLHAFDDRVLNRLLIVNQSAEVAANNQTTRQQNSMTMPGEKINLNINGRKHLSYDGLSNHAINRDAE